LVSTEITANISQDMSALPFGSVFTGNMLRATFENGTWSEFSIVPLQNFSRHPAALVLHYSQTIFEGMKAYRQQDGSIALFRPACNAARFTRSAQRMAIPPVDELLFLQALIDFVTSESSHVPQPPSSLYLRPTIFVSEPMIGVRSSTRFEFFIIATSVGSYFVPGGTGQEGVEIFVSERVSRAAPGGTGAVKAGANYSVTLKTIDDAKTIGSSQVLFLDSGGKRLIEEAGGMSVFVLRDRQLITPPLSGTILPGITRDSLLVLASSFDLKVKEETLSIDVLVSELEAGIVSEVFLSGTAAVVVSIDRLHFENGRTVRVNRNGEAPVANLLRDRLTNIQFGYAKDSYKWLVPIPQENHGPEVA
jgi:branched-chain amino acid aminotransferase